MKKNTVYIFVNGILNFPGDAEGWTDRAVTWINKNTDAKGEKFEYFSGVITRRFRQQYRAIKLSELIEQYDGWTIILVGHSNGCDVILRALKLTKVKIGEVHLVARAAPAARLVPATALPVRTALPRRAPRQSCRGW